MVAAQQAVSAFRSLPSLQNLSPATTDMSETEWETALKTVDRLITDPERRRAIKAYFENQDLQERLLNFAASDELVRHRLLWLQTGTMRCHNKLCMVAMRPCLGTNNNSLVSELLHLMGLHYGRLWDMHVGHQA